MIVFRSFDWFRSMRWGRAGFGGVLWYVVSPFGQVGVVDEYKFTQATPREVADEIRNRDAALGMKQPARYCAAESELWRVERGECTAISFARADMPLMKVTSDADRIQGWTQLASWMKRDVNVMNESQPALVIAEHCSQLRRLIPLLREGDTQKEDLSKTQEAALAHALRIGVMSNPQPTIIRPDVPGVGTMGYALAEARAALSTE